MNMNQLCQSFYGLLVREHISKHQRAAAQAIAWLPLPLTSVHVEAQTFDFCSEVKVTQTYTNQTSYLLESEYIFPLDENSAVCGFTADIDGRRIHGIVKEKSEARKEFNRAKAQGKSTMLLEQKQENVFKISIGNLAANSTVAITLTYITTLDLEGKSNRMVIPSVVAPKYEPHSYYGYNGHYYGGGVTHSNNGFNGPSSVTVAPNGASQLGFFQAMTAQYLGAPVIVPVVVPAPVSVAVKQQRAEPQRFSMKIEVLMPSEIVEIKSETHQNQIAVQVDPVVGAADAAGRLSVPHHATILFGMNADGSAPACWPESLGSKDFVLTITQKNYLEARAVLEVDPATGSQAVQLAFCPQSLDLMDASSLQCEIIFLIDQSGSMAGSGIEGVKSCLEIFIRSLPVACKFNLVSFGSSYRKLFPHGSQRYSQQSIQAALQYAANIKADLGGTEILPPLQHLFESTRSAEYPRQIFLLTDGQVSNTQQLVDLTRQHSRHTRLFTFGLGGSADRHLVKQLASAGRGECEFVSGGSTPEARQELNGKVMRNLIRAMQPSLTDVKVNWNAVKGPNQPSSGMAFLSNIFGGSANSIMQCPETIASIFAPTREIIYAIGTQAPLPPIGGMGDAVVNIQVSAQSNRPFGNGIQGRVEWSIPLNLSRPQQGTFIHKLAARARIGEIQNWTQKDHRWKDQKSEVLKLALKWQLMSNFTSFIIVDDRKVAKPKGVRRSRAVPQVLANAQTNMFNAFLSNQMNPGAPVNSNGFAFQDLTQSSLSMPMPADPDSDYSDSDSDDEDGWAPRASAVAPPQHIAQACFFGAISSQQQQQQQYQQPMMPMGGTGGGSCGYGVSAGFGGGFGGSPVCSTSSSNTRSFVPASCRGRGGGSSHAADSKQKRKCEKKSVNADILSFGGSASGSARRQSSMNFLEADARAAESSSFAFGSGLSTAPSFHTSQMDAFFNGPVPAPAASAAMPPSAHMPQPPMSTFKPSMMNGFAQSQEPSQLQKTEMMDFCFADAKPATVRAPTTGSMSAATLFTVLVQMVTLDGTWNLTQELLLLIQQVAKATNQSPEVQAAVNQLNVGSLTALASSLNLSHKSIGTLLALWTFQRCFGDRQAEWAMMVGKAKGNLRSSQQVNPDQIDHFTQQIVAV